MKLLTPINESVARLEKYNSGEKLLSWFGISWIPLLVVAVTLLSAGVISVSPMVLSSHPTLIGSDAPLKWSNYSPLMGLPIVILSGMCMDRFGRLNVLIPALVMGIISEAVLRSFVSTNYIGFMLNRDIIVQVIIGACMLIVYETVPLKNRLFAVFVLSLCSELGSAAASGIMLAVERKLLSQNTDISDPNLVIDDLDDIETYWLNSQMKIFKYLQILSVVLLGLALVGIVLMAKYRACNLSLWILFKSSLQRGEIYDTAVHERAEQDGQDPFLSGPVPMSREEFLIKMEKETIHESVSSLLKRIRGPFALVILMAIAFGMSKPDSEFMQHIAAEALLGSNGTVEQLGLIGVAIMISSVGLSLVAWRLNKDVRYLPFVGLLLCSIAGFMFVSRSSTDIFMQRIKMESMGFGETKLSRSDAFMFGANYVFGSIGSPIVVCSVRLLIMDLMPTKIRGLGIMLVAGLMSASYGIAQTLLTLSFAAEVVVTIMICAAGVLGMAAMYTTNWFDNSLLCRDPEQDAQWLVQESTSLILPA
jgi:hypothetical protein